MKIRQSASGDQDDDDPTSARLANCLAHGRIEHAIHGDRAVVVEGKGREFHSISENTTKSASAAVAGETAAPIYVTFCSKGPTVKSSWASVSGISSFPQQLPVFRQSSQINQSVPCHNILSQIRCLVLQLPCSKLAATEQGGRRWRS